MTKFMMGNLVVRTYCPHCGTEFKVARSALRSVVTCTECGNNFVATAERRTSVSSGDKSNSKEREEKGCFTVVLQYACGMFLLGLVAVAGMIFLATREESPWQTALSVASGLFESFKFIKDERGVVVGARGHRIGDSGGGGVEVVQNRVNFRVFCESATIQFSGYNYVYGENGRLSQIEFIARFSDACGPDERKSIAMELGAYLRRQGVPLARMNVEMMWVSYVGSDGPLMYSLVVSQEGVAFNFGCTAIGL